MKQILDDLHRVDNGGLGVVVYGASLGVGIVVEVLHEALEEVLVEIAERMEHHPLLFDETGESLYGHQIGSAGAFDAFQALSVDILYVVDSHHPQILQRMRLLAFHPAALPHELSEFGHGQVVTAICQQLVRFANSVDKSVYLLVEVLQTLTVA